MTQQENSGGKLVHVWLLDRLQAATYLAALQEAGNDMLELRLEVGVTPLVEAWKQAWRRLVEKDLMSPDFEQNGYYQRVLYSLMEQEARVNTECFD